MAKASLPPRDPLLAEIALLYRQLNALPQYRRGAQFATHPSAAYAALTAEIRVLADRLSGA